MDDDGGKPVPGEAPPDRCPGGDQFTDFQAV
jgi:hypothetical protein